MDRQARLCAALALVANLVPLDAATGLNGTVVDAAYAPVHNAVVEVRAPGGAVLHTSLTGEEGRFDWTGAPAGPLRVSVRISGFSEYDLLIPGTHPREPLRIRLELQAPHTRITVNATVRGVAEEVAASPHIAVVRERADILKRPTPTIGNALEQEPGILVQQSTYGQVSPFLRGLTGYQVLNLVDGIRFNNSTFRSGPNQYLAFLEPTQAQRVEAMLGPTGVQYGSDSLGGTINVTTRDPRFASQRSWETHGDILLGGASADLSGFGNGEVSVSSDRVFWLGGASGRTHNDLRAGSGVDSRNVFHRLFGMPLTDVRELVGSRQQDSGFRQYGLQTKLSVRLPADQLFSMYYQRGVQHNVRAYKDLLGGLGRVQSSFDPQILDWFYGRYEKLRLAGLDSVGGTFSLNRQVDGSQRQNLRNTDPATRDSGAVNAFGYTGQATTHWRDRMLASFGGEIYDEHVSAEREVVNPVTGVVTRPRPLYPDGSRYANMGVYGQGSFDLTRRVRVSGGLRYSAVRFASEGTTLWFRDTTFNATVRWQATSFFGLHGVVSRGFRAPNLNDLGALGLNDLGYEIPGAEAVPAGALLSTDAGESALSKGESLQALRPESLLNYEAGLRFTTRRVYGRVQLFDAELYDPIVRRTLLFAVSNVPAELAGLPVQALPQTPAQRAQGVTTVATQLDPRAVKAFANDGRSRYYGVESLARITLARRWSVDANYSYIVGRDLNPNRNVRRLPPQTGSATLRYAPGGRRPWVEVSLAAAGKQDRLSGGDRDDERIGASFRRRDIADFFAGSRVAAYLDAGGVFRPTAETLAQLQNRVLPIGSVVRGVSVVDDNSRVPLYTATAGWATLNVRAGIPLGERWQAMAALENFTDRNYRVHGSGVDSPGISGYLCLSFRF